jgi:Flp pilus assembly protein TadG
LWVHLDCGEEANAAVSAGTRSEPGPASRRARRRHRAAQATVEFAIASIVFFCLIFGTIDFGRVIFMDSELRNAVREGARYAEVNPTPASAVASFVVSKAPVLGLTTGEVSSSCSPSSCASGGSVTVTATLQFQAVTQKLLHIGPITLQASATDTIE